MPLKSVALAFVGIVVGIDLGQYMEYFPQNKHTVLLCFIVLWLYNS